MSRTITAFSDSRTDAETARRRLTEAGIDAGRAQIIDKSHTEASGSSGTSAEGEGLWSQIKSAFIPDEDGYAYEEGMRRGGYLLCAEVDEGRADEAIRILDQEGTVDFDQRQEQWKTDGWAGYSRSGETKAGLSSSGRDTQSSGIVEEEHIPLVEEQLRVGKREVGRGGARVRSYIREIPVHEQVNLREEHVSVERRPVDQRLAAADLNSGDLLRERTVEMTATGEEAVVGKEARVREELVLKKTAEERTETIDDTVRRTEVDVDDGGRSAAEDRAAFAFDEGTNQSDRSADIGTGDRGATGYESASAPDRGNPGYTDRINKTGL